MSASSEHEDAEHTAQLPTQPSGAAVPVASPQPMRSTSLPEAAALRADALRPGLRGVCATEGERTTATERKEPMPTTLASMLVATEAAGGVWFAHPPASAASLAAIEAPRPLLEAGICGVCAEVGKRTAATELLPHCSHLGMCAGCKVAWAPAWETAETQAEMSSDVCPICLWAQLQQPQAAAGERASAKEKGREDSGRKIDDSQCEAATLL